MNQSDGLRRQRAVGGSCSLPCYCRWWRGVRRRVNETVQSWVPPSPQIIRQAPANECESDFVYLHHLVLIIQILIITRLLALRIQRPLPLPVDEKTWRDMRQLDISLVKLPISRHLIMWYMIKTDPQMS